MFSREEAKAIRSEFWTTLGKLMPPPSQTEGRKVKWLNYKTGVKDLYFRMDADSKVARFSIDFQHRDEGIRALFYEQMEEFKSLLHAQMDEELIWDEVYIIDGRKEISRIYIEKRGLNLFMKKDWPELFAFFKPKMIALDEFWQDVKEIFKALEN